MFRIFAGENCIHDDATPLKEYKVFNSELKLADNAAGSLEFSMAYTHAFYGADPMTNEPYIKRMMTPITVYKQEEIFWEGRILNESFDFYNTRKIYCEGALAFLNDTCQPQKKHSGISATMFFKQVIANHNAKSTDGHKFDTEHGAVIQFGDVQIDDRVTQFESTYETIRKLIDDYGGHVRIRYYGGYRLIEWLKDYPETSTQTIEFGENLLDFSKSYDMSSLCTVVLPVGKKIADKGKDVPGEEIRPRSGGTSYAYIPNSDEPGAELTISGTSSSGVIKWDGELVYVTSQTFDLDPEWKSQIINLANVQIAPGSIIYYTGAQRPFEYTNSRGTTSRAPLAMWIFRDTNGRFIQTNSKMCNTSGGGTTIVTGQKITVPSGARDLIIGWRSDCDPHILVKKNNPQNEPTSDSSHKHYLKEYNLPANKTVYITTTQDSGYCMYAFKNNNGDYFQTPRKFASSNGITTITESKQKGNDGATRLVVGGRVDAEMKVYAVSEANADYDLYVTVEDAKTNTDHSMYVKNDIKDESDPNSKSALDTYGWIEKKFEWPDDEDPDILYRHAMEYLTNGQFDKLSIELTAVDLQLFGADVESLHVLDRVRVISRPHGMDKIMPITEITIPLDKPETTRYTIGYEEDKSLTNKMAESNANVMVTMNATVNNTKMLDQAKVEAASVIGGAAHGYVTMVPDATTGAWKEIVITHDTPDYERSQDLWRWTSTGLGHFTGANAYNKPWDSKVGVAITYDGKIVANNVNAAEIIADCIKGGTLTVGGINNVNGIIQIKDASGNVIGQFDRTGAMIANAGRTEGTDTWALVKNGAFMFGRGTSPNDNNYRGIVNGRIQINESDGYSAGVSIEAKGVSPSSDPDSNGRGVISLCADELVVATSSTPTSVTETVRSEALTVVTGLNFVNDGQGNTSLQMTTRTLTYRMGLLMSIGQEQTSPVS